jgi:hypothetical protein
MPTATLGVPMKFVTGKAVYQNHFPDDGGIKVYVIDESGALLSLGVTDPHGLYTIAIPTEESYRLVLEAPLYLSFSRDLGAGDSPPEVMLPGGDLDGDGCVGQADITLLLRDFGAVGKSGADVTADGLVDAADLAIVAGNFDPACAAPPVPEATLSPTLAPSETPMGAATATPEGNATAAPLPTTAPTSEATAVVTDTPEETAAPTLEPTTVLSEVPSEVPTEIAVPTLAPTAAPTEAPTLESTAVPTEAPTATTALTLAPTLEPTMTPEVASTQDAQ